MKAIVYTNREGWEIDTRITRGNVNFGYQTLEDGRFKPVVLPGRNLEVEQGEDISDILASYMPRDVPTFRDLNELKDWLHEHSRVKTNELLDIYEARDAKTLAQYDKVDELTKVDRELDEILGGF